MNQKFTNSRQHSEAGSANSTPQNQQTVSIDAYHSLQEEMRSVQQFYQTVFDNANIGIFRCTLAGEIIMLNNTFINMLGYDNSDELRQNLHHIMENKYLSPQRILELLEIVKKNRKLTAFNLRLNRKNGKILIALVKIKIVKDDKKNIMYIDGMVEDITRQQEIELQIAQFRKRSESADYAKSAFLANMSHEIRTPVNGIIGAARLLLDSNLPPEHQELLGILNESAKSLAILVNDILDFSKIEAGKFEILNIDFDLWETLLKIKRLFSLESRKKGLNLILRIHPGVPRVINGDPNRLGQVVKNLVSNAIKFTDEGEVFIKVEIVGKLNHNSKLLLSVSDTGIGIWEENIPKLFKAFSQIDSSYTKKIQGTGLGLMISKKIINLMHGEIWAQSKKGEGSTFFVRIPLRSANTNPLKPLPINEDKKAGMTMPPCQRILLADDNLLSRQVCTNILRNAGNKVTSVASGTEVIMRLNKEKFDLILMDIQMPEMDGIETTRQIRSSSSDKFDPQIPIIALTAFTLDSDREKIFHAGVNDYVSKPIDWKELFLKISQITAQKKQKKLVAPVETSEQHDCTTDINNLIQRFAGQTDFLQELFKNYLQEAPEIMAKLQSAIQTEDITQIQSSAHSIINITGFLQLNNGINFARKIESAVHQGDMKTVTENYRLLETYINKSLRYMENNQLLKL